MYRKKTSHLASGLIHLNWWRRGNVTGERPFMAESMDSSGKRENDKES
jgi:hypothetical protein